MTRIKICGIQQAEDALVAAQEGADFIGLVFVPGRRRRLSLLAAQQVVQALHKALPAPPPVIGLFADQPVAEVNDTIRTCGLNMAQLCGEEPPGYWNQVDASVIKVIHVMPSWDPDEAVRRVAIDIDRVSKAGHWVTLDRKVEGLQGGTGEAFDWHIAQQLAAMGNSFLLAGGLTPDNVAQAVKTARPWGVDVSSGVEARGHKDHAKIRSFIAAVRAADVEPKTNMQ